MDGVGRLGKIGSMLQCPKCGWTAEKGTARFCARCGNELSDEIEQDSQIAPSIPPIHLEPHRRLLTPLFLLSVGMLLAGAIVAGSGEEDALGWVLVGFGLPCLLISVLHRQRH
jgi:DNA-directed RNA polymerase subunit RPC12/RpoP